MAIICDPGPGARDLARATGEPCILTGTPGELGEALDAEPGELMIVIGASVAAEEALRFAAACRVRHPGAGIILVRGDAADPRVLGEALRAGIREIVPSGDLEALAAACRRSAAITRQLRAAARSAGGKAGRMVTVFAAKGGCGKTMVAINLAVTLARQSGLSVCLADLDLAFGDVAITLQAEPSKTIADAVPMAGHVDEAGAASLLTPYKPGLQLLLAPVGPGEAERIPAALTTELLVTLQGMFDWVICDTPAQFSDHVLTAMDGSDTHVLLTAPEIPSLKNLRVTLDTLDMLRYPPNIRHVVLNRFDSRVGITPAEVRQILRCPIAAHVPSSRSVPQSVNTGRPLAWADPRHPVSKAIAGLAATLQPSRHAQPAGRKR